MVAGEGKQSEILGGPAEGGPLQRGLAEGGSVKELSRGGEVRGGVPAEGV